MKPSDLFNDLQSKVSEALRNSPAKDLEKNVRSMMTQGFSKLDLVTREEFDVQSQVLARTRARLEELEQRVIELERRLSPQASASATMGSSASASPAPGSATAAGTATPTGPGLGSTAEMAGRATGASTTGTATGTGGLGTATSPTTPSVEPGTGPANPGLAG